MTKLEQWKTGQWLPGVKRGGSGWKESECGCKGAAELMQTFVAWLLSASASWCEGQDGTSGGTGWRARENVSLIFHICVWIYDYLKMKSLLKTGVSQILSVKWKKTRTSVMPGMEGRLATGVSDSRQDPWAPNSGFFKGALPRTRGQ